VAHKAASRAAPAGAIDAIRDVTPPTGGSSSSSPSLDDWHEFCELVHGADKACQHFSDATREVSRLECYLEAVRVALEASERETTAVPSCCQR
jgi:hypothetical protein